MFFSLQLATRTLTARSCVRLFPPGSFCCCGTNPCRNLCTLRCGINNSFSVVIEIVSSVFIHSNILHATQAILHLLSVAVLQWSDNILLNVYPVLFWFIVDQDVLQVPFIQSCPLRLNDLVCSFVFKMSLCKCLSRYLGKPTKEFCSSASSMTLLIY